MTKTPLVPRDVLSKVDNFKMSDASNCIMFEWIVYWMILESMLGNI